MRIFLSLIFFYFCFFSFSDLKISDSVNRRVYSFNKGFDEFFLDPIIVSYIKLFPSFLDAGVSNFYKNNLELSNSFFLSLSYGLNKSSDIFYRFFLNSYFGLLGVIDFNFICKKNYNNFDFQKYLVISNNYKFNYLILPIIGPCNNNFILGVIFSYMFSPFFYFSDDIFYFYFFDFLNKKSYIYIDNVLLYNTFLDGYIFLKDIYIQNIESLLKLNFFDLSN